MIGLKQTKHMADTEDYIKDNSRTGFTGPYQMKTQTVHWTVAVHYPQIVQFAPATTALISIMFENICILRVTGSTLSGKAQLETKRCRNAIYLNFKQQINNLSAFTR